MKQTELTPQRIMQFAWGYAPTLAIETAVRHGVFDLLDQGPKTVEELAGATKTSIRGMRAILNLLVSLDLLTRTGARYARKRRVPRLDQTGLPRNVFPPYQRSTSTTLDAVAGNRPHRQAGRQGQ